MKKTMERIVEPIRGLPCNIVSENKLWCICGQLNTPTGTGGGVLEWCYDEQDAKREFLRLSRDTTGQYTQLSYCKYNRFNKDTDQ